MSQWDKGRAGIWPEIVDRETAHKAAMLGVWAAAFSGGVTIFSIAVGSTSMYSIIDFVMVCAIGFAIFKHSRIGAIFGVLLCIDYIVHKITYHNTAGILPLFLLYYANGVRGCFAYDRFVKAEAAIARPIEL